MISNIWYSEDDRAWRPGTPLSQSASSLSYTTTKVALVIPQASSKVSGHWTVYQSYGRHVTCWTVITAALKITNRATNF